MKKKIYKKWWFWVIVIIGVVAINAVINPEQDAKEQEQIKIEEKAKADAKAREVAVKKDTEKKEKAKQAEQDKKTMLITTTQEAVKERLKSPSTAKFPWGYDEYNIKETNSTNNDMTIYNVAGYVDAENSFGAKLRNNFIVKLECTNDLTKYRVLDVEIN